VSGSHGEASGPGESASDRPPGGPGDPPGKPAAAELAETSFVVRWVGPAFIACSLVLVPWTVYLALSLPSRQLSPHYNIAWAGFDVLEIMALGSTGYFALRRSRYLAITAAAASALLIVDAWFDIMTSPRQRIPEAIVLAAFVELPLAAVCAWLSYHTEHLAERGITLFGSRSRG
jgi:hypothetical protein